MLLAKTTGAILFLLFGCGDDKVLIAIAVFDNETFYVPGSTSLSQKIHFQKAKVKFNGGSKPRGCIGLFLCWHADSKGPEFELQWIMWNSASESAHFWCWDWHSFNGGIWNPLRRTVTKVQIDCSVRHPLRFVRALVHFNGAVVQYDVSCGY